MFFFIQDEEAPWKRSRRAPYLTIFFEDVLSVKWLVAEDWWYKLLVSVYNWPNLQLRSTTVPVTTSRCVYKYIYIYTYIERERESESFWPNYSDLTRPHPKWWFSKGNPLISGKSRLVNYYNLAKIIAWWFGFQAISWSIFLFDRENPKQNEEHDSSE